MQLLFITLLIFSLKSSTTTTMWNHLPPDLLANIFSYLPPHSLARAMATCTHWHNCASSMTMSMTIQHSPWFLALPTRISTTTHSCFVHNPIQTTWHLLNLERVPSLSRPVTTIGGHGLILFKATAALPLRLSVCNPFTGGFRHLPPLQKSRTNPAVGVIEVCPSHFKVYVAGGMSTDHGYEATLENFDSVSNKWMVMGSMPVEFAVRLTVWTPNESVYSSGDGVLYWMTSARAYSIMGFEMGSNKWRELSVPMGDTLEFAALVPEAGKLRVVGGKHGGKVSVWELEGTWKWKEIERMPVELGKRLFVGGGGGSTKCVGIEGGVCLYTKIGSGMAVWRRARGGGEWEWEWCWMDRRLQNGNYPVKGFFLHPNLAASPFV